MAIEQQRSSHTADHVSDNPKKPVPPTHVIVDQPLPAIKCQPESSDQSNQAPQGWRWFLKPEWVIVYVTIAYSLITLLMWGTIKRQVNLMENTAKRQLRAYVGISNAQVRIHPDGRAEAEFLMRNAGQTPAYDLMVWRKFITVEREFPSPLPRDEASKDASRGILGPQDRIPIQVRGLTITPETLNALQVRERALMVYGFITYRDIFHDYYELEFRLIHGGTRAWSCKPGPNDVLCGRLSKDSGGNEEHKVAKPRQRFWQRFKRS